MRGLANFKFIKEKVILNYIGLENLNKLVDLREYTRQIFCSNTRFSWFCFKLDIICMLPFFFAFTSGTQKDIRSPRFKRLG